MEQYSTTADLEKIFDGAVSGDEVCKARAETIGPVIAQANKLLAPYIGIPPNELQVISTVFTLVQEFGFSTQTFCNMAKIGADKNKLKSEWKDSRPHWVRYIELDKKIKATCQ